MIFNTFLNVYIQHIAECCKAPFVSRGPICSNNNLFGCPKFCVMILSFRADRPGQTVHTQIRLRSSLIRVYTVCHSVCIVWIHQSMVEPHSSNFRVITTNVWVSEYLGNLLVLLLQYIVIIFSRGNTAVVSVNDVTEDDDNDSSAIFEDAEDGSSGPSKTLMQNGLPKSPDSGIQGDKSATELTL